MAVTASRSPAVFTAAGDTWPHSGVKVHSFTWEGPTAGQEIIVKDKLGGNVIFRASSPAGADVKQRVDNWCRGIYVDTMPSGQLLVYYY